MKTEFITADKIFNLYITTALLCPNRRSTLSNVSRSFSFVIQVPLPPLCNIVDNAHAL